MRTELKEGLLKGAATVLVLSAVFWSAGQTAVLVNGDQEGLTERDRFCVVIDAGHGGVDPGKVGGRGELEKEINLKIAEKLKLFLEASDVKVVMTRTTDTGLYDENSSNKKVQDMKQRVQIIEEAQPDIAVSIHQNSYHQEDVSGGQVFYYGKSEKGKKLAQIVQKRFDYVLGEKNTRAAKANDSYYLLLHVKEPIIIVECGFLSNWEEAEKLKSEDYQNRLAWTIHMGILEYLNSKTYLDL